MEALKEKLISKLKVLSETIWENRCTRLHLDRWLDQFSDEKERIHALYILSQFMYFANQEMREMLRSLYRDLFRYPIIQEIRKSHNNTLDPVKVGNDYRRVLAATKFLGVGNPSESGYHLLYYFRQENGLPKNLFIDSLRIFERSGDVTSLKIRDTSIEHYVLIDDFCGSGHQGVAYSKDIVYTLKKLCPKCKVSYYVLFATEKGLEHVKHNSAYDDVRAVFTLDETYMCFSPNSRHRPQPADRLDWDFAQEICRNYGQKLLEDDEDLKGWPLGYDDGQLLIGFFHNIPDNTLPIIWSDGSRSLRWYPIFRRYPKNYGDDVL